MANGILSWKSALLLCQQYADKDQYICYIYQLADDSIHIIRPIRSTAPQGPYKRVAWRHWTGSGNKSGEVSYAVQDRSSNC